MTRETALDCLGGAILFAALGLIVLTLGIWVG